MNSKQLKKISYLFKKYLNKTESRKNLTVLSVFKKTKDKNLFLYLQTKINEIKNLPNYKED